MKLKRENHIFHNCNDQRMINWCIENLDTDEFFEDQTDGGFGCDCEHYDANKKYWIPVFELNPDIDKWEDWMNQEFPHGRVRIYFCPTCHAWAIDDDWDY